MKVLISLSVLGTLGATGCAQAPAPVEAAGQPELVCRAEQCMTRAQWQSYDRQLQDMSAAARMGGDPREAAMSYGVPMQAPVPNAPVQ